MKSLRVKTILILDLDFETCSLGPAPRILHADIQENPSQANSLLPSLPMSAAPKLTKKQKKGLAFRERKTGKGKGENGLAHSEDNDVPVLEDQDAFDAEGPSMAVEAVVEKKAKKLPSAGKEKEKSSGKRKAEEEGGEKSKKRKLDSTVDADNTGSQEKPSNAKRKIHVDNGAEAGEKKVAKASAAKQRFILFVGMSSSIPSLASTDPDIQVT